MLKVQCILTKEVAAAVWHLPANYEVVDWKTTQNHGAPNANAHRVWVERHCHCEEANDGKRDRNKQGNLGKRAQKTIRENWWQCQTLYVPAHSVFTSPSKENEFQCALWGACLLYSCAPRSKPHLQVEAKQEEKPPTPHSSVNVLHAHIPTCHLRQVLRENLKPTKKWIKLFFAYKTCVGLLPVHLRLLVTNPRQTRFLFLSL